jgi:hypothetical protein
MRLKNLSLDRSLFRRSYGTDANNRISPTDIHGTNRLEPRLFQPKRKQ